jgi:Rne/Rng family ribonuclease
MEVLVDELEGSLWVATIEKNRLIGLEIDPMNEEVRWGSIYWARVMTIDKAMDAAFLDLDGTNIGIINNADVYMPQDDGQGNVTFKRGGDEAIGKVLKSGDMIAVQAKSGYLPRAEDNDLATEDKSARVSMNITLAGRHLIHAPMMAENRISKRIHDKKQRKQITKMLNSVDTINGCILRASAANVQTDILIREGKILKEIWEQLQEFLSGQTPATIMLGPDALQRTLSDQADKTISTIDIVTHEQYQEVEEWCEIYAPDLVTKIKPVELKDQELDLGLFDFHDILDQIEDLFQPYVLLKNGGNIIIQETAALTAIDINRSRDNRAKLAINLEAAAEIGRQIRLRNLGGIIIVDFLKLTSKSDKMALMDALNDITRHDPCTVQIHGLTALGLVEMTRTRRTPPLQDRLDLTLA